MSLEIALDAKEALGGNDATQKIIEVLRRYGQNHRFVLSLDHSLDKMPALTPKKVTYGHVLDDQAEMFSGGIAGPNTWDENI